jgi:hypothetical protein
MEIDVGYAFKLGIFVLSRFLVICKVQSRKIQSHETVAIRRAMQNRKATSDTSYPRQADY